MTVRYIAGWLHPPLRSSPLELFGRIYSRDRHANMMHKTPKRAVLSYLKLKLEGHYNDDDQQHRVVFRVELNKKGVPTRVTVHESI